MKSTLQYNFLFSSQFECPNFYSFPFNKWLCVKDVTDKSLAYFLTELHRK